jgi:hypothetical protein
MKKLEVIPLDKFMAMDFPEKPWTEEHEALAKVVRRELGKAHPDYIRTICWRYLDLYKMQLAEALRCVRGGYSSPSAAMFDGFTKDLR